MAGNGLPGSSASRGELSLSLADLEDPAIMGDRKYASVL